MLAFSEIKEGSMLKLVEAALVGAVAAGFASSSASAQTTPQTLPPIIVQNAPDRGLVAHQRAKKQSHPPRPAEGGGGGSGRAHAADAAPPPPPEPVAPLITSPLSGTTASGESLRAEQPAQSDTASLLRRARLQLIYGRWRLRSAGHQRPRRRPRLNGMLITAACANHMNPPMISPMWARSR